jgi:hypothetical protein
MAGSGELPPHPFESAAGDLAHVIGLTAEDLGNLARLLAQPEPKPEDLDIADREVSGQGRDVAGRILALLGRRLARRRRVGPPREEAVLAAPPPPVLQDRVSHGADEPGFGVSDFAHAVRLSQERNPAIMEDVVRVLERHPAAKQEAVELGPSRVEKRKEVRLAGEASGPVHGRGAG